jgi:hypothetical protein
MNCRTQTIVMVIGAVCVEITVDAKAAGYVETVDLGALPSGTMSAHASAQYLPRRFKTHSREVPCSRVVPK